MKSTADIIEHHLMERLRNSASGAIDVQRGELAAKFTCVPSQINYVIATRFTLERGYIVESKRGGGGFIRIRQMAAEYMREVEQFLALIGGQIAQREAEGLIWRLEQNELLTTRETFLIRAAISRDVLMLPLPERDQLRARLLTAMLVEVFANLDDQE